MPKVIEDLRENILKVSKRILLNADYQSLTIRRVATECHVAVGTVYNYFESKDILVATIMLDDWLKKLERAKEVSLQATTAVEGLLAVSQAISDFTRLYERAWAQNGTPTQTNEMLRSHHAVLLNQITDIIIPVLERFDCLLTKGLPTFLAESLLSISTHSSLSKDDLVPILQSLLTPKEELPQ